MAEEYDDLELSEEERAALEEDDEDNPVTDPDDDPEKGDDPDPDDDQDDPPKDDPDDDPGEDPPDDEPKDDHPADEPKEDPPKEDPPDDPPEKDTGEEPTIVDVEAQYEEKIKALDEQLDSGKLDFDEYKKELMALERERTKDLVKQEITRSKVEDTWKAEQDEFFSENEYLKGNKIVYDAFAREVNDLLGQKEWANKPGPDILNKAKETIDQAFGIKPEKPKPKEKTDGQKAVDKAKKSRAKKDAPKTLKDVPAADGNTDGAFEHLDNLEGPALEAAVAKMTPEEQEAWAESL
jgi:hypothetical protein